jgi:UDP-2,4-diacetamido-2,4,6-trideoxy-beta-L-altropyranose hydrolase
MLLFYHWANEKSTRANSYHHEPISLDKHKIWYLERLKSNSCFFYLFVDSNNIPVGQVRIEHKEGNTSVIGISVDVAQRGKGYAVEMLCLSTGEYFQHHPEFVIHAFIFKTNLSSYKSFIKAGFQPLGEEVINGIPSFILYLSRP